jgi:hypothetical protein
VGEKIEVLTQFQSHHLWGRYHTSSLVLVGDILGIIFIGIEMINVAQVRVHGKDIVNSVMNTMKKRNSLTKSATLSFSRS